MPDSPDQLNEITLFAQTNFRNAQRRFGIKIDDRRRHVYVIGKTGMGKTTLLENMILSDIYAGHGCSYIDPHGDTAEKILDFIPSWRINDVVYFNPSDLEHPVGFNILETVNDKQKHLVGSGLMGVFKKIWPDVWSPRMEYILLNCVLALLDYPGATLLGINRLLVDKDYRQRVIEKIRDPIVKTFWVAEFSSWSEKYATEAIAPVQNKVGQFLSASVIRNIVAQVKSTINPRQIMDEKKIFIVNLSKGRIGEDNMRLLGNMIVIKLQLAAMERVDIPEADRKDFFLYVDEFQNFATPSFAGILSEARKYRLSLILAHQYIEQLDETVRDAIFGNVGTIITFRIGSPDALYMEKEFSPTFIPEDLTNLPKYGIYLKLMVDGVSTEPFSATTLPPIAKRTGSEEKVIAVSRERYSTSQHDIEEKVLKWSGMESGGSTEPAAPPIDVTLGGTVSYPEIKTEEELDAEASADHEDKSEYLRFSAERLASIVKTQPAKKKDKPKFKHTCTRCGAEWEMPIQLDPTRPMYCSECLPLIQEEKKIKGKVLKGAVTGKVPEGVELREVVSGREKEAPKKDFFASAMRNIENGRPVPPPEKRMPPPPNRPRIVVEDANKLAETMNEEEPEDEERSELLEAIQTHRGSPVETRKSASVPRDVPPPAHTEPLQIRRSFGSNVADGGGQTDQPREGGKKRRRRKKPTGRTMEDRRRESLESRFEDRDEDRNPDEGPIDSLSGADENATEEPMATVFRPSSQRADLEPPVAKPSFSKSVQPGQHVRFNS